VQDNSLAASNEIKALPAAPADLAFFEPCRANCPMSRCIFSSLRPRARRRGGDPNEAAARTLGELRFQVTTISVFPQDNVAAIHCGLELERPPQFAVDLLAAKIPIETGCQERALCARRRRRSRPLTAGFNRKRFASKRSTANCGGRGRGEGGDSLFNPGLQSLEFKFVVK
jgi:hypothetical protein